MDRSDVFRGEGECLTPEQLEQYIEGKLPGQAEHVEHCTVCAHEAASLREFLMAEARPEEAKDLAWMEAQLAAPKAEAQPKHREPWFLNWFASPAPRWAFGLAAVLVVIAGSLQLRKMASVQVGGGEAAVYRSTGVKTLAPAGDLEKAPAEFTWQAQTGAASYEVRVLEVDRTVAWSARTSDTKLTADAAVAGLMKPGKTLYWQVAALDAKGGTLAESAPERIRVLAEATK